MKDTFLNYFNIFFIVIFFPSFVSGVFLPNLIYFLFLLINVLFNSNKIKLLILSHKNISIIFIFFCILLITSSFLSKYIFHSLNSSLLYFTFIIYVASIVILFSEKRSLFSREDNPESLLSKTIGLKLFSIRKSII